MSMQWADHQALRAMFSVVTDEEQQAEIDRETDASVQAALDEFNTIPSYVERFKNTEQEMYHCGLHGLQSLSAPCSCHPLRADDRVSWEVTPEGFEIDTTPGENW